MQRLLLRPLQSFAPGVPGAATALVLARGDRRTVEGGWRAQLQRAFTLLPRRLPVAALTRQLDCKDAAGAQWLRADPAHVRADMSTVRMLACGDLDLGAAEVEQLLRPLKPVFGDHGFPIDAPCPQRWYLRLPSEARLPEFADPHEALGAPLDGFLPQGDLGKRWRHLLNEAQVLLHNHPLNAERMRQGRLPVNSLWFWGAGVLPDHVQCGFARVLGDDVLLRALAQRADAGARTVVLATIGEQHAPDPGAGDALIDLRDLREAAALERDWIAPALEARQPVQLDFGDGVAIDFRAAHRWRLWRRPQRRFQ